MYILYLLHFLDYSFCEVVRGETFYYLDATNVPLLTTAHTHHLLGISSKHRLGSDSKCSFSAKIALEVLTS